MSLYQLDHSIANYTKFLNPAQTLKPKQWKFPSNNKIAKITNFFLKYLLYLIQIQIDSTSRIYQIGSITVWNSLIEAQCDFNE